MDLFKLAGKIDYLFKSFYQCLCKYICKIILFLIVINCIILHVQYTSYAIYRIQYTHNISIIYTLHYCTTYYNLITLLMRYTYNLITLLMTRPIEYP